MTTTAAAPFTITHGTARPRPFAPWTITAEPADDPDDFEVELEQGDPPSGLHTVWLSAWLPCTDGVADPISGRGPCSLATIERFAHALLAVVEEAKRAHPELLTAETER